MDSQMEGGNHLRNCVRLAWNRTKDTGKQHVPPMYRFGPFQVDPRAHELRRSGIRVKIQEQPFVVLLKLLEHPGELVTREELRLAIWPADTFVDFDTGLNTVVMRLREALGDSAEAPTLIETAPRLGYRFIAPVESFDSERAGKPQKRPMYYVPVVLGAVVLTVGLLAISKTVLRASRQPRVLRFTRLTNDG
jgi:DNA-binding winged helix-turn-helix (wHTH) protein